MNLKEIYYKQLSTQQQNKYLIQINLESKNIHPFSVSKDIINKIQNCEETNIKKDLLIFIETKFSFTNDEMQTILGMFCICIIWSKTHNLIYQKAIFLNQTT